jgi:amyloid beta precursor protein binding protein 1
LTGGIVSQEIIKSITEQYVPVDNTCVFDGIKSKSTVFKV